MKWENFDTSKLYICMILKLTLNSKYVPQVYPNYMQSVTKRQFDAKIKFSHKYIKIHKKLSCDDLYILHTIQC